MNRFFQKASAAAMMLIAVSATAAEQNQNDSKSLTEKYAARLVTPLTYNCHRAKSQVKVDGKINEPAWADAATSEEFRDISGEGFPIPIKKTTMKMLYDNEYLYIAGQIEEDDVTASLTERDAIIYHDNDFEVFIDPEGDGLSYYEFENNAFGTIFDLMLNVAYRSGGNFYIPWDCQGLKVATHVDGKVNKTGKDNGWTVEYAIPFAALNQSGKDPREFGTWRINFSRVEWLKKQGPEENWVWSPTGKIDMHMPERWGFLNFIEDDGTCKGKTLVEGAYKLGWAIFYAEMDLQGEGKPFMNSAKGLDVTSEDMALLDEDAILTVESTSKQFLITIDMPSRNLTYTIDNLGHFSIQENK